MTRKDKNLKDFRQTLREFKAWYEESGYIDEDVHIEIFYSDGTTMTYPEDVESIKLRNIVYGYVSTGDDEYDTEYGYYVATLNADDKDDYFWMIEGQYMAWIRVWDNFRKATAKLTDLHNMTYDQFAEAA